MIMHSLDYILNKINNEFLEYVDEVYRDEEYQKTEFSEKIKDILALKRCKAIFERNKELILQLEDKVLFMQKFLQPEHQDGLVKLIWDSNKNQSSQKIYTIRDVIRIFSLGLKESKDLVERVCRC